MRDARKLDFAERSDARDWLTEHGFYQFAERTFQHRHNGKTARLTEMVDGSASVTIL
jgi:hypothetical protein